MPVKSVAAAVSTDDFIDITECGDDVLVTAFAVAVEATSEEARKARAFCEAKADQACADQHAAGACAAF